ncbi:VOC family protein [Luteococcus peritonei]|uniref:VOC family protein n=1 Tax=Luteococcus peritonei TaxID=88874 RepID=A0ABW4RSY3_9ACTN
MANPVHHIELWTSDVEASSPSFGWLLTNLGWVANHDPAWPAGRTWHHPSGAYVVLEQSPDVSGPHGRTRAGLNHLALRIDDRGLLDRLRLEAADHGWAELFADRYPHDGGPAHTALFLENDEGFELEIVVEEP